MNAPDGKIIALDISTNMTGIKTSFDDHSVYFALPETRVTSDMFIHIGLIGNQVTKQLPSSDVTDVPEPGTLTLLLLALAGIVYYRRKKQRQ